MRRGMETSMKLLFVLMKHLPETMNTKIQCLQLLGSIKIRAIMNNVNNFVRKSSKLIHLMRMPHTFVLTWNSWKTRQRRPWNHTSSSWIRIHVITIFWPTWLNSWEKQEGFKNVKSLLKLLNRIHKDHRWQVSHIAKDCITAITVSPKRHFVTWISPDMTTSMDKVLYKIW